MRKIRLTQLREEIFEKIAHGPYLSKAHDRQQSPVCTRRKGSRATDRQPSAPQRRVAASFIHVIAQCYEVHPVQVSQWKKEVTQKLPEVFAKPSARLGTEERRRMIETEHPMLSVARQCKLMELPSSTFYHHAKPPPEADLRLMRVIDETYLAFPFFGSRQMTGWLQREGYEVNHG